MKLYRRVLPRQLNALYADSRLRLGPGQTFERRGSWLSNQLSDDREFEAIIWALVRDGLLDEAVAERALASPSERRYRDRPGATRAVVDFLHAVSVPLGIQMPACDAMPREAIVAAALSGIQGGRSSYLPPTVRRTKGYIGRMVWDAELVRHDFEHDLRSAQLRALHLLGHHAAEDGWGHDVAGRVSPMTWSELDALPRRAQVSHLVQLSRQESVADAFALQAARDLGLDTSDARAEFEVGELITLDDITGPGARYGGHEDHDRVTTYGLAGRRQAAEGGAAGDEDSGAQIQEQAGDEPDEQGGRARISLRREEPDETGLWPRIVNKLHLTNESAAIRRRERRTQRVASEA